MLQISLPLNIVSVDPITSQVPNVSDTTAQQLAPTILGGLQKSNDALVNNNNNKMNKSFYLF